MKPEEYPSETFCKNTNIVTGVLENFERKKTITTSKNTPVVHFSAFVDLATEISAILPRWRLKLSVYFHLGELLKRFFEPWELIASSRVLKTSGGPFVVRMWYLYLDVIPFTKTVYAACC